MIVATVDDHIQELLKLPVEDRAHAAKLLLDSLDDAPEDPEAEALRAVESDEVSKPEFTISIFFDPFLALKNMPL